MKQALNQAPHYPVRIVLEGYLYVITDPEYYDYIVLDTPLDQVESDHSMQQELKQGDCTIKNDGIHCISVPLPSYSDKLGAESLRRILDKYLGKHVKIIIEEKHR